MGIKSTLEVFPYFRSRARSMAIFNFKGERLRYLPGRTRKRPSALCMYRSQAPEAVICEAFIAFIVTPQRSVQWEFGDVKTKCFLYSFFPVFNRELFLNGVYMSRIFKVT